MRINQLLIAILLGIGITGCSFDGHGHLSHLHHFHQKKEEAPVLFIPPKLDPSYTQLANNACNEVSSYSAQSTLLVEGVRIVTVGQDYKLVFPAELVFYKGSPKIKWESYRVLNDIVTYLSCFNKISVRVALFSSGGSEERGEAISYTRGNNLTRYIWRQDIDARLLYVRSFSKKGDPATDKIEISFRHLMA